MSFISYFKSIKKATELVALWKLSDGFINLCPVLSWSGKFCKKVQKLSNLIFYLIFYPTKCSASMCYLCMYDEDKRNAVERVEQCCHLVHNFPYEIYLSLQFFLLVKSIISVLCSRDLHYFKTEILPFPKTLITCFESKYFKSFWQLNKEQY